MQYPPLGRARRASFSAVLLTLAAAAVPSAQAAIDCWMDAEHPRTADNLAVTDAKVAGIRKTVHDLNALLHRQPELHALPRTRLRSSWQIAGQWTEPARAVNFLLRDHRESVWTPAGCGVIAGADRLEPKMGIVVTINAPTAFFESNVPELKDEQLQAYREVPATGEIRGRTLYGGHMLVFTSSGKRPWVPVTVEEYLDFTERDLTRNLDEARKNVAAANKAAQPSEQEAMLERVAEGLRKTDPKNAEKLIADIRAQTAKANAMAAARGKPLTGPGGELPQEGFLKKVRAYRASLSSQQLKEQARLAMNGMHPPDVPASRYAPLVKPDPNFPWDKANPQKWQMVMVSVRGGQEMEQGMKAVLQNLDVEGIEKLVSKVPGR